jgi:uncharacterized protein YkwD
MMCALVLSAWLVTAGTAHACAFADRPATKMSRAHAAAALRCLVAAERAAHGLAPWRADHKLALAARRHARDMVRRRYFDHNSPEGRNVVRRVGRTGYYRHCMPCSVGENLHWGRGPGTRPAAIVRSWMRSPAHRRVLMSRRFKEVGIGLARGTPRRHVRSAMTTTLVAGG